MGRRAWRRAAAAVSLAGILPSSALAAAWTVSPDITVTATYNDNPSLGSGGARSDLATTVAPGLRIDGRGARFQANLDYRPSAVFYARNSSRDQLYNTLRATARLEAIERFFFIDADASIAQSFISPLAERPADLTTFSDNRTETRTYSLSPYLRGEFGPGYTYEVRNRNTWTTASNDGLGDMHRVQWTGRLASPLRLFGWALDYEDSESQFDSVAARRDLETRHLRGTILLQPDPAWRFNASVGREQNNYALAGEKSSGTTRGAGVAWNPSVRTSASLQYERRIFGPTQLASFQHRTRLTAWNVSYSRNTSDFTQELLRLPPGNTTALLDAIFAARIPDAIERRAAVERFMRASGTPNFLATPLSFYTQQVFLEKRLEASAGILGVRNSITFTVFASRSSAITQELDAVVPDAFLIGRNIRQRGFGLRADHRVTPFTSAAGHATRSFARQEGLQGETRNDTLSLTLNRTVSPRTTGFGGLGLTRVAQPSGRTESRTAFIGVNHRF